MIALTMSLLTTSGAAIAAPVPPPVPYPHARRTRDVGIAVTIPGILLATGGGAIVAGGLISDAQSCDTTSHPCEGWGSLVAFGGAVIVGTSLPFFAIGIPLWTGGVQRIRQNELAITGAPLPEGGMLSLALTF